MGCVIGDSGKGSDRSRGKTNVTALCFWEFKKYTRAASYSKVYSNFVPKNRKLEFPFHT